MLGQINPIDFRDGGFNLIGMIFFWIGAAIGVLVYFKKRTPLLTPVYNA